MPKVSAEYRAERRAHIMGAARRCFVRNGFHASSMQDLVEEADVSSGAVYRYFTGKDDVIEAIAADNLEQVVTVLARAIDDGANPATALASVLEFVTIRHREDGFAAIAVLVWSEALRNPALAAHLQRATDTALATLRAPPQSVVGAASVETGDDTAHVDSAALADLLLCILPGYLMRLAVTGAEAVANVPDHVQQVLAVPGRPPEHSNAST